MSRETVVVTRIVGEIIREAGKPEAVVERRVSTELVTRNIGPRGGRGDPGAPGKDGEAVVASAIIFDGGHF